MIATYSAGAGRSFPLRGREVGREQAEIERLLGLSFVVELLAQLSEYQRERGLAGNIMWEIEAYLLVPELIPGWVRSKPSECPGKPGGN